MAHLHLLLSLNHTRNDFNLPAGSQEILTGETWAAIRLMNLGKI
jgi:hypothetical protein